MEAEGISMVALLLGLGVMFLARWALFTAVVWGLLRVQSLNYSWPGLLLTTALGSLAYFIPLGFLAAAVAFVIVYVGLKKVTQAEHTDLMFSIVISNAIMYVAGLWLLGAVLPDLRGLHAGDEAAEESDSSFLPDYAGMLNEASNTLSSAAGRGGSSGTNRTMTASSPTSGLAEGLQLKGITVMRSGAMAMISVAGKTASFGVKESFTVPGRNGVIRYVCESITTNLVVLRVQGSEPPQRVELKLE